jgi:hypothetical protein
MLSPSSTIDAPRGARSTTWSTARSSVVFACQSHEQSDRLVGDAILRVIQIEAGGFGREAIGARRVVGEE